MCIKKTKKKQKLCGPISAVTYTTTEGCSFYLKMLSIFLNWPNVSRRIFKQVWNFVKKAERRALKVGWLNLNPFASNFKV